jgi:hypothetical protein
MSGGTAANKPSASRRHTLLSPRPRDPCQRRNSHPVDNQEAYLDAYIARLLDDAPPLTVEQRDTLALILRSPRRT